MSDHDNNDTDQPAHRDARLSINRETPALVWFYGLWVGLATLSGWLGHSSITIAASVFLLSGIVCTNVFFMAFSRMDGHHPLTVRMLAFYQAILGIAWTTAYFFFSDGAGALVLGMYMTVLMFAVFHLSTKRLLMLTGAAIASHALMILIKTLSTPTIVSPVDDGIGFLVLIAVSAWIYVYARKLHDLRIELQYRNEELQNVVERITRIAEEDHLTKSFNRRRIMEMLAREKAGSDRSGESFSILLFDLDHFKTVNDRFGHLVGDQILTDFAARVKKELRGMDTVKTTEHSRTFGRYGGEEFLAILPSTDADGAEYCAERIRAIIAGHEFRDRYNITVSVGVAEYKLGETVPQLLSRADEALYQAKRDGRNRVRCSRPPQLRDTGTHPTLRILK
ncbi:MAG: GGDEF domain-containing protein [Gammaproteobacteria bacterium]|nr:GGDEF domain-containing protein [Gammaproteobacteria bacterium]NND54339.1 GGDEF domain-containing protein [Gammaproteobacteria bacterium]